MTSSYPPDQTDRRRQALVELAARSREAPRRAVLDQAAAEAIDALRRAGVDPLILKGAALAQTLYAPSRQRSYYDVDLLIAHESAGAAAEVLSALGYRNITRTQGIDDIGGVLHAELWTRLDSSGNVSIDLHRRLAGCQAPDAQIWRSLRRRVQVIHVASRPVLTLDNPGLALHVALHLAQHGSDDVKAAADLRLGLVRWPADTWREAAGMARELEALEAFSAGLRLLPEGESMIEALGLAGYGEMALDELRWRAQRPRGTYHLEALSGAATFSERLSVIRRALFPARDWIKWEVRWAGRSPLHLVGAYFVHLTRTPLWAARALRFWRHAQR